MRLRRGSSVQTPVLWYFVPQDAPLLGQTVFHSRNWGYDPDLTYGVGEVIGAPRPWRDGSRPGRYSGQGQCGTPAQFRLGLAEVGDPPPPWLHADFSAPCCRGAAGGLQIGRPPRPRRPGGGLFATAGLRGIHVARGGLAAFAADPVARGGLAAFAADPVARGGLAAFAQP